MVQKHQNTTIRQRQITDAARKVIIKHGSEHATVRKIAKEVGISEAAVYRHFKSKRDILSLLVDHIGDSLVGDIERVRGSGHGSLGVIDSLLRSHFSAVEQKRGVSFQVIAEIISLGDKRLNRKASDAINEYINCLKSLLSEGVKAGEVKGDVELEAAATILFGMMQGLVNIWVLSNHSFDLEQKYAPLWGIFSKAISNRQSPILTKS